MSRDGAQPARKDQERRPAVQEQPGPSRGHGPVVAAQHQDRVSPGELMIEPVVLPQLRRERARPIVHPPRTDVDYGSVLIEMFLNCTRLGGEVHTPSFFEPWCCSPIGPSFG